MSAIKHSAAVCLALSCLLAAALALADDPSPVMVQANDESPNAVRLRAGSGSPIAGKEKSFLCQGCHGTDGNSFEALIPKLAGQYGAYIVKEIHNYQSGARSHPIMNAMAGTVENDADLADIGAYFASQPKMKGRGGPADPAGEEIFLHGDTSKHRVACVGCHGVRGKGVGPKTSMYPVLGGQQKEYLRDQITRFRDGYRTNSPNDIMNNMTKLLTDDEIEGLADYISAQ
jgi:cytochrome c553